MSNQTGELLSEIKEISRQVNEYVNNPAFKDVFAPKDIAEGIFLYLNRPAKSLRPAIMMFACGAVGGRPETILPAAAAVEVFHNWTLVHDDIIDNDALRRGTDTAHVYFEKKATAAGQAKREAADYGRSLAILVGDTQHAFAISLLTKLYGENEYDPAIVLKLIDDLEMKALPALIEGETLDVQMAKKPIEEVMEEEIVRMMAGKTGALYEYAARSGAMLGLETVDINHPLVSALAKFAYHAAIAFQVQDDILGLVGDQEKLGKPVGSDIREGKRTLVVVAAFKNANEIQKAMLLHVLGNHHAKTDETKEITRLLIDLGGLEYAENLAKKHIAIAQAELNNIPDGKYKELLASWSNFMLNRSV